MAAGPVLPFKDDFKTSTYSFYKTFGYKKYQSIDVLDPTGYWYEGRIVEINTNHDVLVHYKGFKNNWDKWIPAESASEKIARLHTHTSKKLLYYNTNSRRYTDVLSPKRKISRKQRNKMKNYTPPHNSNINKITLLDDNLCDPSKRKSMRLEQIREEIKATKVHLCAFCCTEGASLMCNDRCLRFFHPQCLLENLVSSNSDQSSTFISMSEEEKTNWKCEDCIQNQHRCTACGKYDSDNSIDGVQECQEKGCGHFFHLKCINNRSNNRQKVDERSKKGEFKAAYTCLLHYCAVCFRKSNTDEVLRCIRCPSVFHSQCIQYYDHTIVNSKQVICSLCKFSKPETTDDKDSITIKKQKIEDSMIKVEKELSPRIQRSKRIRERVNSHKQSSDSDVTSEDSSQSVSFQPVCKNPKCSNPRVFKSTGKLHRFCELHRNVANQKQRVAYEKSRQMSETRKKARKLTKSRKVVKRQSTNSDETNSQTDEHTVDLSFSDKVGETSLRRSERKRMPTRNLSNLVDTPPTRSRVSKYGKRVDESNESSNCIYHGDSNTSQLSSDGSGIWAVREAMKILFKKPSNQSNINISNGISEENSLQNANKRRSPMQRNKPRRVLSMISKKNSNVSNLQAKEDSRIGMEDHISDMNIHLTNQASEEPSLWKGLINTTEDARELTTHLNPIEEGSMHRYMKTSLGHNMPQPIEIQTGNQEFNVNTGQSLDHNSDLNQVLNQCHWNLVEDGDEIFEEAIISVHFEDI